MNKNFRAQALKTKKDRLQNLSFFLNWWERRESNSHGSLHMHLKHARIPIPPRPQILFSQISVYFAFGAFAAVFVAVFAGVATFETFVIGGTVTGEIEFASAFELTLAFVFAAGDSVVVSGFVDKTETPPFNAGIASINADNIKTVAATIVVFDKTVAVPRAP